MTGGSGVAGRSTGDVTAFVAAVADRLAADPAAAATVAVSRGMAPNLRRRLEPVAHLVEAPAVRGRAVWAATPHRFAAVEQPNWWGRSEHVPDGAVVLDRTTGLSHWDARVGEVRRAARTLTQLGGVRLAFPRIDAPWFVLLLPVEAGAVAEAMDAAGVPGGQAVGPGFPDLPGGLRLHPPNARSRDAWVAGCVACITQVIGHAAGERP